MIVPFSRLRSFQETVGRVIYITQADSQSCDIYFERSKIKVNGSLEAICIELGIDAAADQMLTDSVVIPHHDRRQRGWTDLRNRVN